jgi:hypothetical protein
MDVCHWLSPLAGQFENRQLESMSLTGRQDGKGKWLLETDQFDGWLNGSTETLWCSGIRMYSFIPYISCQRWII